MRKIFFWLHLAAGVLTGLVVMWMSLTGVLLTYEKQIIAWYDRGALTSTGGTPKSLESWLAPLAKPGVAVTLRRSPTEPVEVNLGGRDGIRYIDAGTGKELGKPHAGARPFFQKITAWHRYLGQEGPGRATGKLITGVCNLAFLFLVLSGAYLWLPRKWTSQHLRPIIWFRGGLSGKARDFNWHNTLGFWCLVPLAAVVAGAVPISFVWANDFVYRLAGSPLPTTPAPPPPPAKQAEAPQTFEITGLDAMVERAKSQNPNWTIIGFRLPNTSQAPIGFTVDWGTGAQPQKRGVLTLARDSAASPKWEAWEDNTTGRRLRLWLRFLHTGEALGYGGQALAGLASAGAVVLGYSGLMLAWRRFANWRRQRSHAI